MFSAAFADFRMMCLSAAGLCTVLGDAAAAESVVYCFQAERSDAGTAEPLKGSVAARIADIPRLSGCFGYDVDAPVLFATGIPGQVAFAAYDTGFIRVDDLDLGRIAVEPEIRVTDGMTRMDDPRMTIPDGFSMGLNPGVTETPADYLSLEFRFADAEQWQGTDLPVALDLAAVARAHLRFAVLVGTSDPGGGARSGKTDVLGALTFVITSIQRVE